MNIETYRRLIGKCYTSISVLGIRELYLDDTVAMNTVIFHIENLREFEEHQRGIDIPGFEQLG